MHVDTCWKTCSKKFSGFFPEVRQELKITKKRIDDIFKRLPADILEDLKLILDNLTKFEAAYFESLRKQEQQSLQLSKTFKSSKYDFFNYFTTAHALIPRITFSNKKQIEGCLEKIGNFCFSQKKFIVSNTPEHALQSLIIEKLDSIIAKCKDKETLFFCGITISLEEEIQALLNSFKANQYKTRIVGGYVRDKLRSAKPHDVDIVASCSRDKVEKILNQLGYKYFVCPSGSFPSLPPLIQIKNPLLSYSIDITCIAESLEENAGKRDITVNALFCDEEGNVLDPLGVIEDINNTELRIIGDIEKRIQDDPKMIFRLMYYHFYLEKELPPAYIAAIQKHGYVLDQLPLKVYKQYMYKLFLNDKWSVFTTLDFLTKHDLLKHVWPSHKDMMSVKTCQHMENTFDAFLMRYTGEMEILQPDRVCFVKGMASIAWKRYHSASQDTPSLSPVYLPHYKGQEAKSVEAINGSLHSLEITKSPKQCLG